VPPLLKDSDGSYRNPGMSFADVIAERATVVDRLVASWQPDVVLVDRHPFGTGGELRPGLARAKDTGARLITGLRDVIDEPSVVRDELAGDGWRDTADVYDDLLVYGSPGICDHETEYDVPLTPRYCGWVVEPPAPDPVRHDDLVVVTAGGGGDGRAVFELGIGLGELLPDRRVVLVAGPYAASVDSPMPANVSLRAGVASCVDLVASAGAVVQMAGYNATVEALAAGVRPVLVPRRHPRREQAIRASRLAAWGLADVVDEDADPAEVAWLLSQPRLLPQRALSRRGIRLDGAATAARILRAHAHSSVKAAA
jgi:predicted glycosyltransferase